MLNKLLDALAIGACVYFLAMCSSVSCGKCVMWIGAQQVEAQDLQNLDISVDKNQQHVVNQQHIKQLEQQVNGEHISQSEADEEDLPEWKGTILLRPGSAPYKEIAGTWEGEYSVYNTKYELTLEVGKRGKESVAIFIFQNPKKRKKGGSFEMKCEYSPKNKLYTLSGTDWLERPRNYTMVDMTGTVQKGVFRGAIFNVNGNERIGRFKLEKSEGKQ